MDDKKNQELTAYGTKEDVKKADELSKHFGRSISNLIVWLINEKWKELKK